LIKYPSNILSQIYILFKIRLSERWFGEHCMKWFVIQEWQVSNIYNL